MVQSKHKKSKPKRHPQAKKHGMHGDISNFRAQLDLLGLKVIQVTADGNCFFRALADQLEGNEEEHEKYRHMVVQYIVKNREMFEPFIEDEVPFDEYCQSMEKDGTWAGNMELQAASLVTCKNICIHRHMSPRWYIQNFDKQGSHMIHLGYHDGEHYNSIRSKEDNCSGPAKPVLIKADVDLTASAQLGNYVGAHCKAETSKSAEHGGAMKIVMAGSPCDDVEKFEQVLLQVDGDVDAAIEFLIAEQEAGETIEGNDVCRENDKNDNDVYTKSDKQEEHRVSSAGKDQSINSEIVDKKIPRNKVCTCGSKKKYKACCGAASGKTFSKVLIDHEVRAKTGKRGKRGKVAIPKSKATSCRSNDHLPDLGALCI